MSLYRVVTAPVPVDVSNYTQWEVGVDVRIRQGVSEEKKSLRITGLADDFELWVAVHHLRVHIGYFAFPCNFQNVIYEA